MRDLEAHNENLKQFKKAIEELLKCDPIEVKIDPLCTATIHALREDARKAYRFFTGN